MPSSIKKISIVYDPVNENNTFSSGDHISGRVTVEVEKETEIKSFLVHVKGKARVLWTRRIGNITMVYYDKETIFKTEQVYIQDAESGGPTVLPPGCHVYPFTFQIPPEDMPSSFDGAAGKVVYSVKAKLDRRMHLTSKERTEFTYVSRTPMPDPDTNESQSGDTEKKLRFLNSGDVSFHSSIDNTNYYTGGELKVTADIHNNSSRSVKPKFCLYQKQTFYALQSEYVATHNVVKEVGEPIKSSTKKSVTFTLAVPPDVTPTTLNCRILKVEYFLKVYLDVKYSRDPDVTFPVGIYAAPQDRGGASASASASASSAVSPSAPPQPASAPEALDPSEPPPAYDTLYPPMAALSLHP